jgi:hypothetical protein
MHANEKMPWKIDGALQAQVDCHVPVPRVIPAAISAPMLYHGQRRIIPTANKNVHSLIKVIERTNAPSSPAAWKRLGEINTSRHAKDSRTEA